VAVGPPARTPDEPLVHRQKPPPQAPGSVPAQPDAAAQVPPLASEPAAAGSVPPAASFPPADLADAVRRLHGVDVSDVVVSRGPEADRQAHSLGARAFTSDGEIMLPSEAGPVERSQTRALLAHELTHAAQQRALGPSLPPEHTREGAALEDAAVATEHLVLGGRAVSPSPSPPSSPSPAVIPVAASVQRQTEEPPGALPAGNAFDPLALLPRQGPELAPVTQAAISVSAPAPSGGETGFGAERARLIELTRLRVLDLDDSVAVAELADGIYQRVRAKLQRELLIDRERSGLLSDFR
jgi:hypothetical protein